MEFAEWTDKLSVEIESVDGQHRKLIDLINETSKQILSRNGLEAGIILEELKRWTEIHFSEEEALFSGSGYPDVEKHKEEHRHFVDKLEEMDKDYKQNDLSASLTILQFLKNWLFYHIEIIDKTYAPYVKKKLIDS